MSNIYIQEPPTNGKVLLKTSVGELEVELWSKEAPKVREKFKKNQIFISNFLDLSEFHAIVFG